MSVEFAGLIEAARIVPVVVIDDADCAIPLAETLRDSGLGIIEITLRTPEALKAIEKVAHSVPEMLVGAGSIRSAGQMVEIGNAGADFAVSPGATERLVTEARRLQMPFIPGAATPSEILVLLEQGFTLQKFFPAQAAGGIRMLRAFASPIPEVQFMPTGGISPELASDYLAEPNVAAIGGSWITPPELIRAGEYGQIATLARQAARLEL